MSAATIAAMVVCLEEDRRRRVANEEAGLITVGSDETWMDWAGPLILIGSVIFCFIICYIAYN